jgi:benzoylformate decarboxylase
VGGHTTPTVRDVVLDVLRRLDMRTIFGNPGSTEIPFLTGLPDDIDFVLGLHEGSVVGMASGYALARGKPTFVNLHTAAGLGNAVNAIVGARDNRVPLVVVVGQQDRRQLARAPFLTGRSLERLAGDYPVWTTQPAHPQDVPAAIARAWLEASASRGPALVVVPMGDWEEPADLDGTAAGTPARVLHARAVDEAAVAELAAVLAEASSPALVVGAGADSAEGWAGTTALAETLACPVWQEPFGSRAGFPQDHVLFAGHLPWSRAGMREALAPHDVVVAVGAPAFRLYIFDPGPPVNPGTRVLVVGDDLDELHRSSAELALAAAPGPACHALAARLPARGPLPAEPLHRAPAPPAPPAPGEPLRACHVLAALAERLPADAILMEEAPSTRPELLETIPARAPLGFLSVANGALGFGLAGSIGLRLGQRERPVVAVLGDGASMYAIQSLWSAAQYGVGVVLIVLANGGYRVMDQLARDTGRPGAWPAFDAIDFVSVAAGLGVEALGVATHDELLAAFDAHVPTAGSRTAPLLVEVKLAPDLV